MTQAITIETGPMTAPIARAALHSDPMVEWAAMREQAQALVKSGFLPRAVDTPEKAIAIMQTGRELGIGPMQALRCIHIIDGKPVMAAELIAGLVLSRIPGALLRVSKTTSTECIVLAARPGQESTEFRWSMEDAQKAGLTGKQNWRNYPRAMLRNRCLAEASRGIFPDATMGLYDPDELGAVTTATGEIIATPDGRATPRRGAISPHVDADQEPDAEAPEDSPFPAFDEKLRELEKAIDLCGDYDRALEIRSELGSKARLSQLNRDIQSAGEARTINPQQKRLLGQTWQRCDRKLSKLEKELAPRAEDIAHMDPEDVEGDEPNPEDDGR